VRGQAVTMPAGDPIEVGADSSRAYWIGTRAQLSDRGFRLAGRTLEKIERSFLPDLTDETREMLRTAQAQALLGIEASGPEACRMAIELADATDAIGQAIETQAPVDLAKLVMRVHAELACVAAGETGAEMWADRVEEVARGDKPSLKATTLNVETETTRYISPWPELEDGGAVPAEPERNLLPYLIEARGTNGDARVLTAAQVDVVLTKPIAITAAPTRVFRGDERRIDLSVAGQAPAQVTVALKPPAGVTADPAEFTLQVGEEPVTQPVTLTLAQTVTLGSMTVGWQATSDDARYNVSGEFKLAVAEPVPSIVISRTPAPTIDGDLGDAAWQREPDVPAFGILANGDPASEATAAWLAYDDEALYIAFRCGESQMAKLVAKHQERGAPLYRDDDVEVFIMPPDATRALQFAVNALGTISDSFGNEAPWSAAAKQYEDRWTVEMRIPWVVLGMAGAPGAGSSLDMQLGRQEKPKSETTSWTPGRAFNVPAGFGLVVFE